MTVAVPASVTIGLATHAGFQRFRIVNAFAYTLAGFGCACLMAAIAALASAWTPGFSGLAFGLLVYGGLTGALTGYFGWLIRRPDRDPPPNVSSA